MDDVKSSGSMNLQLNLTALQRLDYSITSIVDSASQVCLYNFSPETHEWEKTDVEGTLFVYMRTKRPQHGFIVMNRVSTTNLVESVTSDLEFTVEKPFLLYRNTQGGIHGLWFYQSDNCVRIGKLLSGLSQLTVTEKDKSPNAKLNPNLSEDKKQKKTQTRFCEMDIMSLLSRAQEEYDKKQSTQSKSPANLKSNRYPTGDIVKPTPVRANGVVFRDSRSTSFTVDTLFAQVGDGKHVFNGDINRSEKHPRSRSLSEAGKALKLTKNENILEKLLSNSDCAVVKNAHNDVKPPSEKTRARSATVTTRIDRQTSVEMVEKDLKAKLNILPLPNLSVIDSQKLRVIDTATIEKDDSYATPERKISETEAEETPFLTPAMLSSSLPNCYCSPFNFKKPTAESESNDLETPLSFSMLATPGRHSPTLLSPMDFKVSNQSATNNSKCPGSPPKLNASFCSNNSYSAGDNVASDLLLPQTLIKSSNLASEPSSEPLTVTPLTKAQLREALTYMCQHDDDFINQVHECYLKSLKCQLNHFKHS